MHGSAKRQCERILPAGSRKCTQVSQPAVAAHAAVWQTAEAKALLAAGHRVIQMPLIRFHQLVCAYNIIMPSPEWRLNGSAAHARPWASAPTRV
jgi:hypothetical protein